MEVIYRNSKNSKLQAHPGGSGTAITEKIGDFVN